MKLCIVTAFWKRPIISRAFLDCYKELVKFAGTLDNFTLDLVGAYSEPYYRDILEKNGCRTIFVENNPLGAKWNTALSFARASNPDYILIMGSDNLINIQALRLYYLAMQKNVNYAGYKDIYWYNYLTKDVNYWPGYDVNHFRYGEPIGAGRLISKQILDQFDWILWEANKNKGLDFSTTVKFLAKNISLDAMFQMDSNILVDIKGGESISKIDNFEGCIATDLSVLNSLGLKVMHYLYSQSIEGIFTKKS